MKFSVEKGDLQISVFAFFLNYPLPEGCLSLNIAVILFGTVSIGLAFLVKTMKGPILQVSVSK